MPGIVADWIRPVPVNGHFQKQDGGRLPVPAAATPLFAPASVSSVDHTSQTCLIRNNAVEQEDPGHCAGAFFVRGGLSYIWRGLLHRISYKTLAMPECVAGTFPVCASLP